MSTYNIHFCGEIRKLPVFFGEKKMPYLALSSAMIFMFAYAS